MAKLAFGLVALCLLTLPTIRPAISAEILGFPQPKAPQTTPHITPKPTPALTPAPVPAPVQQSLRPAGIANDCKEWTDSCRVCALDDKGAAACSNVGIACLPEKWRGTRP